MSTKFGLYHSIKPNGVYLFEEALIEGISPAYIQVGPGQFKIEHEFANEFSQATVEIPADEMDQLAIAWCKHRGLEGALGGPVGKEFGGPECPYTQDED